jgi:hypothetical protein
MNSDEVGGCSLSNHYNICSPLTMFHLANLPTSTNEEGSLRAIKSAHANNKSDSRSKVKILGSHATTNMLLTAKISSVLLHLIFNSFISNLTSFDR